MSRPDPPTEPPIAHPSGPGNAESRPEPCVIASFALVADFAEDRLRLDALDKSGIPLSILLTRRLLDRFVPLLARRAEKPIGARLPKAVVLSMSQQRLRLERRRAPATTPITAAGTRWLCASMRLADRRNGSLWTLTGAAGQEARFLISHANTVALLDLLAARYRRLDWPTDRFPDWTIDNAETAPERPAVLH